MSAESARVLVVLGAGVVGLSTALKIQEKGHDVTIVADVFPEDAKSIGYTSCWAGAHHVGSARNDTRQQKMNQETFRAMWEMSEPGKDTEECFLRIPHAEYYCEKMEGSNCLEFMPDYRALGSDDLLPPRAECGVTFTTLTIDTPVYLRYLWARFRANGGNTQKAAIQHIAQLAEGTYTGGARPDAIVICAGLGARVLGGVEDKAVYPLRGQTVLLRAPWVKFGRTQRSNDGTWTYIIPRRSGDVIVGGSMDADDWQPQPRPEITSDILARAMVLCPELSPTYASNQNPTVEDIKDLIIEEGCGLRPARKGGIRLEKDVLETAEGPNIPVVFNYGHGGYGYLSSWGSAAIAASLLESALS